MSCLDSLLGYFTEAFQALQLIVLAVFGAVDQPLASCMLVLFFKSSLKWHKFDIMENNFFIVLLNYDSTYILGHHNMIMLYFHWPYFHVSNCVFLHSTLVLSFYIDVVLTISVYNLVYLVGAPPTGDAPTTSEWLSGVPNLFDRNKILSGGDLSHYQVPHCIRVFFSFVWFVFIHHNFQFYFELCTYCNILDIYLS